MKKSITERTILIFVLITLFTCCKNNIKEETRNENSYRTVSILDNVSDESLDFSLVDIIILETGINRRQGEIDQQLSTKSESSLLGNIKEVIILDTLMIIWERHSPGIDNIYFFNSQGEYQKKLTRGKGPNEIINVQELILSPSQTKFAILEASTKIKEYSLNGKQISKKRLPFSISTFSYLDDNTLVLKPSNYVGKPNILYQLREDKVLTYDISRYTDEDIMEVSETKNFSLTNTGTLYYTDYLNDTIYEIDKSRIYPKYVLDFGNNGLSNTNINFKDPGFISNWFEYFVHKKVFYQHSWFCFHETNIYFFASRANEAFIYRINTEDDVVTKSMHDETTASGIPLSLWKLRGNSEKGLIFSLDPMYISRLALNGDFDGKVSDSTIIELTKLNDISNPVLVIVK